MRVYKINIKIRWKRGVHRLVESHHKQYSAYKHALQRGRRHYSRRPHHPPDASRWSGAAMEDTQ